MNKIKGKTKILPQPPITDPKTGDDFLARGWSHYSKNEFFRAESDFRKALEDTPDHPDYLYGLALALQASGRSVDAVQTFEKVIQVLTKESEGYGARAIMLSRLARAHINRIKTGGWNMGS